MIPGIWSVEEFKQNTVAKGGKERSPKLKVIDAVLDLAHAATESHHGVGLDLVDKECRKWIREHPNLSSAAVPGKKVSNRLKGIEALLDQIAAKRSADSLKIAPGGVDPRLDKSRAAFHQELVASTINRLITIEKNPDFNTEQIAFLAANKALRIDDRIDKKKHGACTVEALRILCAMLGKNRELALHFLVSGIEVIVVAADRPMTDLPEFSSKKGQAISQQGSGPTRVWDDVRGAGGLVIDSDTGKKVYVAITEENLLGTKPTFKQNVKCYAKSYSTTTHEFAHALHLHVLTEEKKVITAAFNSKKGFRILAPYGLVVDDPSFVVSQANIDAVLKKKWTDGPRYLPSTGSEKYTVWQGSGFVPKQGSSERWEYISEHKLMECYASLDEREYFAQCVNAYLGSNAGKDAYTKNDRNNGAAWVRANEPAAMVQLLDELFSAGSKNAFGKAQLENTNPADDSDEVTIGNVISSNIIYIPPPPPTS